MIGVSRLAVSRRVSALDHPLRWPCGLAAAIACLFLWAVPTARGSVPIYSFDTLPSSAQAGAHPDIDFSFHVGNRQQAPSECACGDSRNVTVHLPTGLIGNTHATPQCTISQFTSRQCPVDSQVGVSEDRFSLQAGEVNGLGTGAFLAPIYNLVPPPDQPALFGFIAGYVNAPIFIDISARTDSDYGVDATVFNINHALPLLSSKNIIWGVPAARTHDYLRFAFEQGSSIELNLNSSLCDLKGTESTDNPATALQICRDEGSIKDYVVVGAIAKSEGFPQGIPSNSPEIPFFQNPTTCGETTLATSLDILAYDGGSSHADSPYPATTDCALLSFNPSQAIEPTTTAADSPSGAEFRLTVPQFESPAVPSPSELRAAVVTLPAGFSLAPNVTNGKLTCSDAQARFGTTEESECPENSKVGTISVETPVLPGPLPGAVYLGEPKPGNRFRLILSFNGFGVHVKLAGTVTPDPTTGQIRISFQDLPQAPFADFNMHIFGAERGPLDTPTRCGEYEVTSEWTPWDSALSNQISSQVFDIDEGPDGTACPSGARPFSPRFQAASEANTAGVHTGFSFDLVRKDGEQNLKSINVTTPPGFAATLRGVSYCPEYSIQAAALEGHTGLAEQASPSCPASSQVGELTAGSGPGSHPLYLPGKVYLAGPYRGALLSLVFITPAVSAGYDLGNVVLRTALRVDPETARVTAVSDPLPQIFGGIPLRLREIMVNLDRPGFVLNPTNCDPLAVTAQIFGDEGAVSDSSQRFQVANCASLPYAPRLSLRLTGGLNRLGHPAIHSTFTAQPGEANTRSVSVALPKGELLDNAHINTPCTRVQLNAGNCPPGSLLGHAVADTPLLDHPLDGPVYLTTGFGHNLPDLVADLHGQIHIILDGKVDTINGGALRTTFQTVPDAPVSSLTLNLAGGAKGLIRNSESLCSSPKSAIVQMTAQSGKGLRRHVRLQTACRRAGHSKRRNGAGRPDHRGRG